MSLKNIDLIDYWISAPSNNKVASLSAFVEQTLRNKCCNKKEVVGKIGFLTQKCQNTGVSAKAIEFILTKNTLSG